MGSFDSCIGYGDLYDQWLQDLILHVIRLVMKVNTYYRNLGYVHYIELYVSISNLSILK